MGGLDQWLSTVPGWVVLLVAFAFVFAESALFAGFVIPGETVLLLGGVLAGLGHVNVVAVALCGIVGAILGDSVGFEIGRHLGPRLRTGRLGRIVKPTHWERADALVARYGGRSVFLGRWVSFGRALVPALVGATRMRYPRFLFWNALGGATWAVTVTAIGYFAGGSWRQVEKIFGRAILLVALALIIVALVVVGARWIAHHPDRVRSWGQRVADRPFVRRWRMRYARQLGWLGRRFRPGSALGLELTAGLVLIVLLGWAFGAVVRDVVVGTKAERFDGPVLAWLAAHRDPELTQLTTVAAAITGTWGAVVVAVVGAGLLAWRWRRWTPLILTGTAWGGALLAALAVAATVGRTGPPAAQAAIHLTTSTASFPAVEIAATTAVVGMLAALVSLRSRRWSVGVTCWAAGLLWAGAAGAAALYLGTHWMTDVLAGYALGAVWDVILLTAWMTFAGHPAVTGHGARQARVAPEAPGYRRRRG
ncbi:VTT domain-containing protein [Actinopolymorpha alba]|uniref:VTT domain-containing protein n=1 Tax=Actinopolymorpha alba TaxID=533267 RepID=UPI000362CED4|nr:VTT domain-containing protein [Actinopolymorpha alba]